MPETNFDFSIRSVPEAWSEAAKEAPRGTPGPLIDRGVGRHRLPSGMRPDLLTGALTGTAMTVISGAAWFALNVGDIYRGPWLAILLGALIAVSVRLGAGPAGPEQRATVGGALYLVAVLMTTYFIVRQNYSSLYRRTPAENEVESIITSEYLSDPVTVVAWVAGLVVMLWLTFVFKSKHV